VAVPPPVATPTPARPEPVAVPIAPPAPAPRPVAAPAQAPAPVAAPAPVIVPQPPKPAPARSEVATAAPAASPLTVTKLDAKTVEQIFSCFAPGLPAEWKRAWVIVSGSERAAAKFYYSNSTRDEAGEEFVPCNAQEITRRIVGFDATLPADQRGWRSARLVIDSEGTYELKYDYAK
jgi:hypothetical protein